jgi:hypothetical protein
MIEGNEPMADDDDFYSLLDDPDDFLDERVVVEPWQNKLIVPGPVANSEDLNKLEMQWRRSAKVPVMFTHVDEATGEEVFENPAAFMGPMGLDRLPSLAEAEAFMAAALRLSWPT